MTIGIMAPVAEQEREASASAINSRSNSAKPPKDRQH
jgi:hypothetical protein